MERYHTELKALVGEENLRAGTLSGPWGVGKTYFVRDFLKNENKLLRPLGLRPAYISLFGLQTMAEVRSRTAAATLEQPDDESDSRAWGRRLKSFLTNIISLPRSVRGVDISRITTAVERAIENRLLRRILLCLDDLERTSIDVRDVLGFISELTDSRGSKCILILNADKLGHGRSHFTQLGEKVFDFDLRYAPSSREVIGIGLPQVYHRFVLPVIASVKCANIRVLKRIEWIFKAIDATKVPRLSEVREEVLPQAAKLAYIHFECSQVIPDVDEILTWSRFSAKRAIKSLGDQSDDQQELNKKEILAALEYDTRPYDKDIVGLIKNGILDNDSFQESINKAADEHVKMIRRVEYGEIWNLFKDNFQVGVDVFIERLMSFLDTSRQYLEPGEIELPCDYLLHFAREKAGVFELVCECLAPSIGHIPIKDRAGLFRNNPRIANSGVLEKVPFVPKAEARPSLGAAMERLTENEGWNPEDFAVLEKYNEEEIERFLLSYKGRFLFVRLRRLFDRLGADREGRGSVLRPRFNKALEQIAQADPLNRERVDKLVSSANDRK